MDITTHLVPHYQTVFRIAPMAIYLIMLPIQEIMNAYHHVHHLIMQLPLEPIAYPV